MPSGKNRRRLEVLTYMHERLADIAETEGRTVTSVLSELLYSSLQTYRSTWIPSKHLERVNERAHQVLALAQEEARGFNHNYIGTEHLLLGLLREGEGVAGAVLRDLGITSEKARLAVEAKVGRGTEPAPEEIDYVPRVRRVLGLAMDEAQSMGSGFVRTEHILLGIVREGGGMAADILDGFGALGRAREEVLARLGQASSETHKPGSS